MGETQLIVSISENYVQLIVGVLGRQLIVHTSEVEAQLIVDVLAWGRQLIVGATWVRHTTFQQLIVEVRSVQLIVKYTRISEENNIKRVLYRFSMKRTTTPT